METFSWLSTLLLQSRSRRPAKKNLNYAASMRSIKLSSSIVSNCSLPNGSASKSYNFKYLFMAIDKIQPDPRWEVLYELKTHEEFAEKFVPMVYLHPTVNKEIRDTFDSIRRQLVASYYHYESVDSAARNAVFSLEMALKIRYVEIYREACKAKQNFQNLLKHFQTEGYFEINDDGLFKWLRDVRNHFAHPTMHSFGGIINMRYIFIVADLINDLYENRALRAMRKSYTEMTNIILQEYAEQGATIQLRAGEEYTFYRSYLGFLNNAVYPNIVTMVYKPIFPIPKEYAPSSEIMLYNWRTIACNELIVDSDALIGLDERRHEIFRITKINEAAAKNEWKVWKKEFDDYRQIKVLFDHADHSDAGEKCALLKKAFHERQVSSTGCCI
jgi:hypothetical protein